MKTNIYSMQEFSSLFVSETIAEYSRIDIVPFVIAYKTPSAVFSLNFDTTHARTSLAKRHNPMAGSVTNSCHKMKTPEVYILTVQILLMRILCS